MTFSAEAEWRGTVAHWNARPESHPEHRTRWTEIHPPDLIEVLEMKNPTETVRGVAMVARPPIELFKACERVSFELSPEAARPPNSRVVYEELRGPESYFPTGENADNGSWVERYDDRIAMHAQVCGAPNVTGRFERCIGVVGASA